MSTAHRAIVAFTVSAALAACSTDPSASTTTPGGDDGGAGNADGGGLADGGGKPTAPGGGVVTAVAPANPSSPGSWSQSLATDGTYVFWIESGGSEAPTGTIHRAKADGSGAVETVAKDQAQPVALGRNADGVFWVNGGTNAVMGLRNGAAAPLVLGTASGKPNAVWVDGSSVWWVQAAPPLVARARANPEEDGYDVSVVVPVPEAGQLTSLAIFSGDVYFTDTKLGSVAKASAGGGQILAVAADQPGLAGIAAGESAVVWANQGTAPDYDDGSIVRVLKDGSGAVVAEGRKRPGHVVADGAFAYWLEGPAGEPGRLVKAPLDGGEATVVADTPAPTSSLAADATHLYWAAAGSIWRAAK